jgi:hypothetical protein
MIGDWSDGALDEPEWVSKMRERSLKRPLDVSDPVIIQEACQGWFENYIEIAEEEIKPDFQPTDELKQFLTLTEALAKAAELNNLNSSPLVAFLQEARRFYYKLADRLPIADPAVHVLLDRLKYKLEFQQPPPSAPSPPASIYPPPIAESPSKSVLLYGRGDPPIVHGLPKRPLTKPRYEVVKVLLMAGDAGLSKSQLEDKSLHGDARRILSRLAESDAGWDSVISFPGIPGGGYRIR